MFNQEIVKKLQIEAELFLKNSKLVVNGIEIFPKEIEIYYYQKKVFEDGSVHRNELQSNRPNHFYIHRNGLNCENPYKPRNRAGVDFVISNRDNVYYSYLLRSAVVADGNPIVGPNNLLKAISEKSGLSKYSDLENTIVKVEPTDIPYDVLFSKRINLGKNANEYLEEDLRAVLCDESFKISKYSGKEKMIVDFLSKRNRIGRENACKYAKEYLGYVPKDIKTL